MIYQINPFSRVGGPGIYSLSSRHAIITCCNHYSSFKAFFIHILGGQKIIWPWQRHHRCWECYKYKWEVNFKVFMKPMLHPMTSDFDQVHGAQLFSTNAFSSNTFSLNVLPSFTGIYSQSIVNTNNFLNPFIKDDRYLENDIGFIRIKPIVWE